MIVVTIEELRADKLFIRPPETHPYCHAPSICEAPSGRLLVAFYAGQKEGAPDSVIFGAVFDKEELTWSAPQTWVHVPGRALANPRLFIGPDQAIWLLFGVNYGPRWCSGDTYLFVKRSYDEGSSWFDMELFIEIKGLLGKNKPFHENKLWLFPLEWERTWSATFLRSVDNGKSWQLIGDLGKAANAHLIQPAIVRLSDGRLAAYMRSQEGWIYVAYSTDDGFSWSTPTPTTIPNNNSGLDLIRSDTGLLILACNPVGLFEVPRPVENGWPEELAVGFSRWGPRSPLVLLVSNDEGATWPVVIVLESGPGEYSYPSLLLSSTGYIHVVYTYRRRYIAHVAFSQNLLLNLINKGGTK